jgi:hypothetical protein
MLRGDDENEEAPWWTVPGSPATPTATSWEGPEMSASDLRFYAEFQCYPTWVTLPTGGEDNPDPHDLGLPEDLADAVLSWSDEYDALFDESDFSKPLFGSDAERLDFDARGRALAEQVARAVGPSWRVRYHGVGASEWVVLS